MSACDDLKLEKDKSALKRLFWCIVCADKVQIAVGAIKHCN